MARILRGEIYWADLNPIRGHEQGGLRPVLVLSHDVFNERSGTVIAVADHKPTPASRGFRSSWRFKAQSSPKTILGQSLSNPHVIDRAARWKTRSIIARGIVEGRGRTDGIGGRLMRFAWHALTTPCVGVGMGRERHADPRKPRDGMPHQPDAEAPRPSVPQRRVRDCDASAAGSCLGRLSPASPRRQNAAGAIRSRTSAPVSSTRKHPVGFSRRGGDARR